MSGERPVSGETIAYKILTAPQMAELLEHGRFAGAPVDLSDGYIHLSTAGQVRETLDKHFAGQDGLHIAAIDLGRFGDAVEWEVSRGGALFPHLYADLTLGGVVAHGPVEYDQAGNLLLPGTGE